MLTAASGEEALKQVDDTLPDLILLDIMMPGTDGFETCRRLKENELSKDIPVIFMTALTEATDKVKGFELGAVDYVTKPLEFKELLARVTTRLTLRKLQLNLQEQNKALQEENFRRRRVQEVLRESRERYRLLAENTTDIISRQTPKGIFRYVSPACRILLGYAVEEMVGKSALAFVHPDDLELIKQASLSTKERSHVSTVTYRGRRKDNSYIWLETTTRTIRDPETDEPLELIAVSRDVTERKEAQEAVQKARDELEIRVAERTAELKEKNEALSRLDELKDEFLANTSHELRTPLNGIIGIAESLIDGAAGQLTPEQIYNLSMIVASGGRLANLVNDILDFSKLKHQEIHLQLKAVDMRAVTNVIITLSQPLIDGIDLQLVNQVDPDLPRVHADEGRVQQIMHNLIGNAIKFTQSGTVTISASVQDNMLAVTVSDTGMGIPPDKFDSIFQSFEQLDASTTRSHGGTGLGLSITKQLVELHRGILEIRSVVGQGSDFTFTLPLYEGVRSSADDDQMMKVSQAISRVQTEIIPAATTTDHELVANKNFAILVVDDELINVQVLTNYLSLQNYGIVQAFDGFEALEAIEDVEPDLVLLDVMMPKMSGYEVCRKIRENYPAHELPVVLLTAKNQISDLIAGFEVGANDYLTKPFDKNEILARVKTHLRLAKINVAYGRFVPHEFLRFLNRESIVDVHLGDQVQRDMTILFSDIRDFTALSESMNPQENFNFLNAYLGRVSPIIHEHHGFIDKYIGDAIMALFPENVENALQAAIEMRQEVSRYNQQRQEENKRPINIGIGLHTGSLMLGTIGETRRMEGTVISDAVNLASRLEGLTKLYGVSIIISEQALFSLHQPTRYTFRFLDRVQVQGKKETVAVFEIFDGDPPDMVALKLKTQPAFERGLLHYHSQEFTQAKTFFEDVITQNPQDKAVHLYLKRVNYFSEYGVPPNWEGVEALTEK